MPGVETGTAPSERVGSLSLIEYATELTASGTRVFASSGGELWMRYESGAMMRLPTFATSPPAPGAIDQVLWQGPAIVATYLLKPDHDHPANAWLYACSDRNYSIEKLGSVMRRNVRRGSRELRIEPLHVDQLLESGFAAFRDTRARVGVSDGTHEVFTKRFSTRGKCRGHVFLGAWHDRSLAAFLSITAVDDWAEIEGCFSTDASLSMRPNDTLMAAALSHYLTREHCTIVSYGLSSIQSVSNAAGLHEFKTKVGFEARPVYRAFVPHPLLAPFVNRLTYRCVSSILTFTPGNRMLKKCEGMLSAILGRKMPIEAQDAG